VDARSTFANLIDDPFSLQGVEISRGGLLNAIRHLLIFCVGYFSMDLQVADSLLLSIVKTEICYDALRQPISPQGDNPFSAVLAEIGFRQGSLPAAVDYVEGSGSRFFDIVCEIEGLCSGTLLKNSIKSVYQMILVNGQKHR